MAELNPLASPACLSSETGQVERESGAQAPANDLDGYLVTLGQRVRSMRAVRGMSRKVLAREAGVSERYIAQVETGLGNVSIMLLRRIADAAGAPLEDLVSDSEGQPKEWPLLRELIRKADPGVIEEVKTLLSGRGRRVRGGAQTIQVDRIALIGLRGAGKSTLGRMVAEKLGWRFVELNREIEAEAGFSVAEVFSLYGQDAYRRYEQAALDRIIAEPGPMVLAVGGGIVSDPVTFERLLGSFFTVWVKASPAEHMSRVRAQGDYRPMAAEKAAMTELVTILQSREPLYSRARVTLETSGTTVEDSLASLLCTIRSYCVSACPWQSRNRAAAVKNPEAAALGANT
jgi:XRE family transcriptional regulator, aerobic/anaerobic benzoate catabolism transcriptional regulator